MLPMKYSVELLVPPEELDPPDEPEPLEEDPEPPLTLPPPGKVRVEPLVEKTTEPFWSVRYVEIPAEESLERAALVGCP